MSPLREYTGFAVRLRELRERAGLTQAQLGEKAGIHAMSLARLERAEREPAWGVAIRLADALGVTLDELRGNPDVMPQAQKMGRPVKEKPEPEKPAAKGKKKGGK